MNRATEKHLIVDIAVRHHLTQSVIKQACREILEIVREGLVRDGVVTISKFGSFRLKPVAARRGVNPKTGAALTIAAHQRIIFSPSKVLRELIEPHHQPPIPLTPELPTVPVTAGVELRVVEASNPVDVAFDSDHITIDHSPPAPQHNETTLSILEETTESLTVEAHTTPFSLQHDSGHEIDLGVFESANRNEQRRNRVGGVVVLLLVVALTGFLLIRREAVDESSTPPAVLASSHNAVVPQPIQPVGEQQTKLAASSPPSASTNLGVYCREQRHHVARGESLWSLAENYYHEPLLWPHIFQANRDLISNPDQITLGAELLIPTLQGAPDRLSDEDQKSIAEGYRMLYTFYKAQRRPDAFYALLMAKHFEQGAI